MLILANILGNIMINKKMEEKLKAFERLLIIMDELREKCPWDKKQTIESLRHLTIEETYELADAILDNDAKVKVPTFIKIGDKIKVDTRTGEYVSKA